MRREHLFAAFFFAVFAFLLYQFYHILYFFVGPLSWAALLALVFYPVNEVLTRWLRRREGVAAFVLTTAVILIVIVPTIYLSALVSTQSVELYHTVDDFVRSGRLTEVLEQLRASRIGRLWQGVMPTLQTWNVDLPGLAIKASNAVSTFLVSQAPAAAANVLRFVTNFFLTTFALFFFFRDGPKMVRGLRELIPMEPEHKDAILNRLYDTLSAVVQGTLVTAFVQGVLAGIGFWIVGVPFATLLGGATAFLSLLPFVGPVIWLSVVVYLAIQAAYARAIFMFLWGALIVGTADNFLRPLIIGNRTQIPTIFLFFGILGGLQAYGFLGVFLGPVLIAILVAFVRIYREEYAMGAGTSAGADAGE
jgi:predicted PurR-regulated permease PerM